ncbi:uncharacterized protein PHACADRAFT_248694, partial [Phanerochaete carnosa HHB-10118-sp]
METAATPVSPAFEAKPRHGYREMSSAYAINTTNATYPAQPTTTTALHPTNTAEASGSREKIGPKTRTNTSASNTSAGSRSSAATTASSTSASTSSSAMASTAASSASCTSGSPGWRSSVGSTPPTSPGLSDASHFKGYFQGEAQPPLRQEREAVL